MTRTEIINLFIEKNNYKSYLEIGTQNGKNFEAIKCAHKVGVDPEPMSKATHHQTSDEFFKTNEDVFDIIFIDGLHHAEQVISDIANSLLNLKKGGTIVCHDINPTSEKMQQVPRIQTEWTGDCWKAFMQFRENKKTLKMFVVDTDYGVGVIQRGKQETVNIDCELTYENFVANRKEWLNLISVEEFLTTMNKTKKRIA